MSRHQAVCGPDTAMARGSVPAGMETPDFNSVDIRPLLTCIAWALLPTSLPLWLPTVQQQHPDYAPQIPLKWQEGQTRGPASLPSLRIGYRDFGMVKRILFPDTEHRGTKT